MYCCDEIHMYDPMNLINLWAYLNNTLSSKKLLNNKLTAEWSILIMFELSELAYTSPHYVCCKLTTHITFCY